MEFFNMSILDVKELTHSFSDKKLFNNANMQLFRGDKLGLTGLNGAGKSTFIGMLINEVMPDSGYIKWNPKVRIGYLDQHAKVDKVQTVKEYLCEAYKALFEAEKSLEKLNNEISVCKDEKKLEKLLLQSGTYQELLESNNFYSINSEIEKVAAGLGINSFGINTELQKLSGGQRAKTMLAKLLLEKPDVLLLDEPTNFLDKEHIDWLAKYLSSFDGSFIIVSHDFSFLNRVINCICDIEFGIITRFNGNYESFMKQKEQKRIEYVKNYNTQRKEVAKLEEFIEKNIARASTSALAKSRRKKLEKIELIDKPNEAPKPTFLFKYKPVIGKTLLKVNNLAIGYTEQLIPSINLEILIGQKLAVTGFNGIGKTTFLKTICGLMPPISGNYSFADKISIGYFEQENKWESAEFTPLQFMKDLYPTLTDKELRGHLSRCGLKSEHVMQKLSTLSGGEQAKVKLCKLILKPYNVLILDEPTNHLDVNAVEQLKKAIKQFEGSILFVSHNKKFCSDVADKELNMESLFD
jgi:ATPase subunit of ABC transporter with duplicated ATPase domains